ncbi:tape measure protein [Acinetobacter sp. WCHAc010052]|uniref:tape measure protein n=1 Tax=Acinetobacter sp. WCHAc010052 TaxID=2004647 RepID=UPI000B3C2D0A|nr:tape measure protein [Acinetobacter sp. WCHAc010052]AXY60183.1 tape measure domain-containing protein [Acinetobacter sp. WCHAc010052]
MSGKNLTFKLVLDGDSKGLISAAKQSEETTKHLFKAIESEAEKLKIASGETSAQIGNLIPSEIKLKVSQLVQELSNASSALEGIGDDAQLSGNNLKQFGVYGEQALKGLQDDLKQARLHLNYLSATNATPADIQNAQQEVRELEVGVKQVRIAFDAYSNAAESASSSVDELGDESGETSAQIGKLDTEIAETNKELSQTRSIAEQASQEVRGLKTGFSALTGALAALGIGTSAMEIAQTADEYKNLSARVNIAIGDHGNLEQAMNDVTRVAIESRSNLVATGELYSRLTKIGQEMKWTQGQALALTETINKAIQVGGGSAASNEAAITQLNQALGSGVLRGDEFNSMMEQSPRLAQAMADGLGVTTGELRELAGQGKLTTDVVTQALLSQSERITEEFNKFPTTIGASIENLKTAWTVYIGEADAATGASAKVAEAIKFVAENLDTIVSTLMLAGQAFIAYKAFNIAKVFLDKAAGVRAASVAIAQETTAVVANTQAQLANAAATRGAATAKTQLAASSASSVTSMAATGGSVTTLISRLGALGVAVTAVGVLVGTVAVPFGTWLGEAIAKAGGYGKALEKLEQQQLLEAARAKVSAEIKAEQAAAAEKARDKTYQLTEASKQLVTEFDEIIKKGEPTKDALDKISQAMKFDSTKGINDAVTALIMLKDQGKITGDELQLALGKALNGKDLLVFETNARAAFAGTSKEAEKTAALTEAVLKAALERTGLSTEQLQGKFSLAFQSASNDVQVILGNLDLYKQKGIDTGLALASNLNKAIDTAQTRAELDYAKAKLLELEKQGLVTGEQVALGLGLIEKKAQQLPNALNPAIAAFNALGIKTKEQLNEAAESAKRNFEVVSKSGQATADGIKQAYTTMLNAAIASGDKAQIAAAQAKAASHGLAVEIDSTGKASVKSMDELSEANTRVRHSAERIGDGYKHAGRVAREEAVSASDAWKAAIAKARDEWNKEMKRQGESLSNGIYNYDSYNKGEVVSQIKSMGYSDDEAERLAGSIWSQAMSADRDAKSQSLGKAGNPALMKMIEQEFNNASAKGQTTQHGTNKVNELLRNLTGGSALASNGSKAPKPDYSEPAIASPNYKVPEADTSRSVAYQISIGGENVTLYGDPGAEDSLEKMLAQLGTIKKRT